MIALRVVDVLHLLRLFYSSNRVKLSFFELLKIITLLKRCKIHDVHVGSMYKLLHGYYNTQSGDTDKVKVIVLSLSPQSRASLAVEHKLRDAQLVNHNDVLICN